MPRKKKDVHQRHLASDHFYRTSAKFIKEAYAGVDKVVVNCVYTDSDQSVVDIKLKREFTQEDRAWFTLLCPYPECKMGGFDLESDIRQAINKRRSGGQGTRYCSGRLDGWECRCKLSYTFEVVYG